MKIQDRVLISLIGTFVWIIFMIILSTQSSATTTNHFFHQQCHHCHRHFYHYCQPPLYIVVYRQLSLSSQSSSLSITIVNCYHTYLFYHYYFIGVTTTLSLQLLLPLPLLPLWLISSTHKLHYYHNQHCCKLSSYIFRSPLPSFLSIIIAYCSQSTKNYPRHNNQYYYQLPHTHDQPPYTLQLPSSTTNINQFHHYNHQHNYQLSLCHQNTTTSTVTTIVTIIINHQQ